MRSNLIKDVARVCSLEPDQGCHAGAPTMLSYQSKVLGSRTPRRYLSPPPFREVQVLFHSGTLARPWLFPCLSSQESQLFVLRLQKGRECLRGCCSAASLRTAHRVTSNHLVVTRRVDSEAFSLGFCFFMGSRAWLEETFAQPRA